MAIETSIVVAQAAADQGAFPPFQPETFLSQLIWLVITFTVLYTLMVRIIAPRLHGIIENRQVTIARDLDTAALAKQKAEEAGEAYEKGARRGQGQGAGSCAEDARQACL